MFFYNKNLDVVPTAPFLYFVTSLMSDVLNNYARGIEKVSDVAIGGIIGSVSIYIKCSFCWYLSGGLLDILLPIVCHLQAQTCIC